MRVAGTAGGVSAELLAQIQALEAMVRAVRSSVERMGADLLGPMLTAEQFAEALGGVEPDTVTEWCHRRAHGKFARAQKYGKVGYRIPAAYLYYTDAELDAMGYWRSEIMPFPSVTASLAGLAPVNNESAASADRNTSRARSGEDASEQHDAPDFRRLVR